MRMREADEREAGEELPFGVGFAARECAQLLCREGGERERERRERERSEAGERKTNQTRTNKN